MNITINKLSASKNPYPRILDRKVNVISKIKAVLGILTEVFIDDNPYFKAPMKIYLGFCRKHKIWYLDYLHGFPPNQYLICPLCYNRVKLLMYNRLRREYADWCYS